MKRCPAVTKGALTVMLLLCSALHAYPVKPVRVIVPFAPGGPNDVVARIVFRHMASSLEQQFVIENRAGASGVLGTDIVAKSTPDGYTILVHSAAHVANAHLYKQLPYDPLKDFIGVSPLAVQVAALVVHPSMPVQSVRQLITVAKAPPGAPLYASSGNGTFSHMAMALFNYMAGTQIVHVPYKGAGPAVIALASGETQVMIANAAALLPHIRTQRLRALAVTSHTRTDPLSTMPTLPEAGVAGYELSSWVGCFVPSRTPKAIIDELSSKIRTVLNAPDVAQMLSGQTLDPWFLEPQAFAQHLRGDYEQYRRLVRLTGAHAE